MENNEPKYRRVLLKLSGEALAAGADGILNFDFIGQVAQVIKKCTDAGVQVGVLCGAGNIWRGRQGGSMNRCRADHMGMLATTINALALQDVFEQYQIPSTVMSAVEMNTFADHYTSRAAVAALDEGKVVIFGGGSGLPFFSTDIAVQGLDGVDVDHADGDALIRLQSGGGVQGGLDHHAGGDDGQVSTLCQGLALVGLEGVGGGIVDHRHGVAAEADVEGAVGLDGVLQGGGGLSGVGGVDDGHAGNGAHESHVLQALAQDCLFPASPQME